MSFQTPSSVCELKLKTKESGSLVSRPIWASAEPIRFEMRIVTAHEWLRRCEAEHPGCRVQSTFSQNKVFPARILDVDRSGSKDTVALIDPYAVKGAFKHLALSHCVSVLSMIPSHAALICDIANGCKVGEGRHPQ